MRLTVVGGKRGTEPHFQATEVTGARGSGWSTTQWVCDLLHGVGQEDSLVFTFNTNLYFVYACLTYKQVFYKSTFTL